MEAGLALTKANPLSAIWRPFDGTSLILTYILEVLNVAEGKKANECVSYQSYGGTRRGFGRW